MPFGSLRLSDLAKILMKFSYSLSSSSSAFTRKKSSASCFSAGFSMNKPEYLIEKNGFYAAAIHGVNMYPMLKNHRDTVFIEAADKLKKKDVVLYRRAGNNQLVLHRLIKIAGDGFIMCGDNEFTKEIISRGQIIGVMSGFTHNGKKRSQKGIGYKLYVFLWTTPKPIKHAVIFIYMLPRRLYGKVRKCFGKKSKKD